MLYSKIGRFVVPVIFAAQASDTIVARELRLYTFTLTLTIDQKSIYTA